MDSLTHSFGPKFSKHVVLMVTWGGGQEGVLQNRDKGSAEPSPNPGPGVKEPYLED